MAEETRIDFPCDFPIKIMGESREGFAQTVAALVQAHAPDFDLTAMAMRPSSGGKYLSLTCTVRATSKAQLDALYRDLTSHPWVKVVL